MALPRDQVIPGLTEEFARFAELIEGLDEGSWQKATRCEGWTVADVAAHTVGTVSDVAQGRFAELAQTNPSPSARQVEERKGRSAAELAAELRESSVAFLRLGEAFDDAAWNGPAPGGIAGTVGDGAEAIWYDTYVHGEDIRDALGLPSEKGAGIAPSLSHIATALTQQGWGPATLALDGQPEFPVGDGSGKRITGDPLEFVLAATGRGDPTTFGLDETVNIYR